jgi:hypothetical protein
MEDYLNEIFQPLSFLFFRVYSWPNKRKNFSIQGNIFQVRKEDINLNIYKFQIQLRDPMQENTVLGCFDNLY